MKKYILYIIAFLFSVSHINAQKDPTYSKNTGTVKFECYRGGELPSKYVTDLGLGSGRQFFAGIVLIRPNQKPELISNVDLVSSNASSVTLTYNNYLSNTKSKTTFTLSEIGFSSIPEFLIYYKGCLNTEGQPSNIDTDNSTIKGDGLVNPIYVDTTSLISTKSDIVKAYEITAQTSTPTKVQVRAMKVGDKIQIGGTDSTIYTKTKTDFLEVSYIKAARFPSAFEVSDSITRDYTKAKLRNSNIDWHFDTKVNKWVLDEGQYIAKASFPTLAQTSTLITSIRASDDSSLYIVKKAVGGTEKYFRQTPFYSVATPSITEGANIDNSEAVWKNPNLSITAGQTTDFIVNGGQWRPAAGDLYITDFGASTASADNSAAINKGLLYMARNGINGALIVPEGTFNIAAPLIVKSNTTFKGANMRASVIKGATGYVGNIIQVDSNYIQGPYAGQIFINNLTISQTTAGCTGLTEIRSNVFGNSVLENLWFLTTNCIDLLQSSTYTQMVTFRNIVGIGSTDKLLHLSGNFNHIYSLNKEAGTGTSLDPYVKLTRKSGDCTGNVFKDMLIEGAFDPKKIVVQFDTASGTIIDHFWIETAAGLANDTVIFFNGGTDYKILNCKFSQLNVVDGTFWQFTNCTANIDVLDFNSSDPIVDLCNTILRSTLSSIDVGIVKTRRSSNMNPLKDCGFIVGKYIYMTTRVTGQDIASKDDLLVKENLISNGSFEKGTTGWTVGGNITASDTIGMNNIGRCLKVQTTAAGQTLITQNITITTDMVGQTLTLSCNAKLRDGTGGFFALSVSGAGVSTTNGIARVYATNQWYQPSVRFTPTATGTLQVVLYFLNCHNGEIAYVDNVICGFGKAVNTALKQSEINFTNNRNISYASTIPTYTTNVVAGDLVLNTANNTGLLGWIYNSTAWEPIPYVRRGSATLTAGTVTVSNTSITANSKIMLTVTTAGGTQGFLRVTKSAGVSFTITSTSNTETSVVDYIITE